MVRRWAPEEEAWLAENYGRLGPTKCTEEIRRLFGRPSSISSVCFKARSLGLRTDPAPRTPETCRAVRWCEEPEMQAWMEANECGQPIAELSAAFAARFGFPLSKCQISLWRSSNGRQARRSRGGGRPLLPVGTERVRSGYVEVKVRQYPTVPQSKDNWVRKHYLVYERTYGPVPEGCNVIFADRDTRNFAPENLVAVPRKLIARINSRSEDWHDRATVLSVVASEQLASAILDAKQSIPRTCAVCGREFELKDSQRHGNTRTCPACVAAGLKAPATYKRSETPDAICPVCGASFAKERHNQTRCRACIDEAPSMSASSQRRAKESRERRG